MDDKNPSFLDRNTVWAVLLSILFFMGWQFYIEKKYPSEKKSTSSQGPAGSVGLVAGERGAKEKSFEKLNPKGGSKSSSTSSQSHVGGGGSASSFSLPEKTFSFEGETLSFKISSSAMGFKEVHLKTYSNRKNEPIEFATPQGNNFGTYYRGQPVDFQMKKKGEGVFWGLGKTRDFTIEKTMEVDESQYVVRTHGRILWNSHVGGRGGEKKGEKRESIEIFIGNKVEFTPSSFLMPVYEGTEFFALVPGGQEERERVDFKESLFLSFEKVTLASFGTHYFTLALVDQSPVVPWVQMSYNPALKLGKISTLYSPQTHQEEMEFKFVAYMGPKKYDTLYSVAQPLSQVVDYGIFGFLSKPMLSVLKGLEALLKNWGLAIIFLTLFVRCLLLPINISSMKSMKKMQKIQPQLKAIKEQYKGDPQKVNMETLSLMKREKANPIGGCLPLLLQIPVFFALYSVLGQSIELYKSPFIFWIQDLSTPDPYYILPLLVGLLYFVQMSLTPQTTMDPTQQKVMKVIPFIFCFFMVTVPSGLVLYFFVNTLFGVGQQVVFNRQNREVGVSPS